MYFLFKMGIFHSYVCLPEGTSYVSTSLLNKKKAHLTHCLACRAAHGQQSCTHALLRGARGVRAAGAVVSCEMNVGPVGCWERSNPRKCGIPFPTKCGIPRYFFYMNFYMVIA